MLYHCINWIYSSESSLYACRWKQFQSALFITGYAIVLLEFCLCETSRYVCVGTGERGAIEYTHSLRHAEPRLILRLRKYRKLLWKREEPGYIVSKCPVLIGYVALAAITVTTILVDLIYGVRSSNELQWLDYMIGYQDSNGCQATCPNPWASYQIRKNACSACAEIAGNVFPTTAG